MDGIKSYVNSSKLVVMFKNPHTGSERNIHVSITGLLSFLLISITYVVDKKRLAY